MWHDELLLLVILMLLVIWHKTYINSINKYNNNHSHSMVIGKYN